MQNLLTYNLSAHLGSGQVEQFYFFSISVTRYQVVVALEICQIIFVVRQFAWTVTSSLTWHYDWSYSNLQFNFYFQCFSLLLYCLLFEDHRFMNVQISFTYISIL